MLQSLEIKSKGRPDALTFSTPWEWGAQLCLEGHPNQDRRGGFLMIMFGEKAVSCTHDSFNCFLFKKNVAPKSFIPTCPALAIIQRSENKVRPLTPAYTGHILRKHDSKQKRQMIEQLSHMWGKHPTKGFWNKTKI